MEGLGCEYWRRIRSGKARSKVRMISPRPGGHCGRLDGAQSLPQTHSPWKIGFLGTLSNYRKSPCQVWKVLIGLKQNFDTEQLYILIFCYALFCDHPNASFPLLHWTKANLSTFLILQDCLASQKTSAVSMQLLTYSGFWSRPQDLMMIWSIFIYVEQ